jgi:hypothetical protein
MDMAHQRDEERQGSGTLYARSYNLLQLYFTTKMIPVCSFASHFYVHFYDGFVMMMSSTVVILSTHIISLINDGDHRTSSL